jgi:hypothetical protein
MRGVGLIECVDARRVDLMLNSTMYEAKSTPFN